VFDGTLVKLIKFPAEHLTIFHGTLVFRGTPVENHCAKTITFPYFSTFVCGTLALAIVPNILWEVPVCCTSQLILFLSVDEVKFQDKCNNGSCNYTSSFALLSKNQVIMSQQIGMFLNLRHCEF